MGIAAQNLLKGNLIDNAGMIKATLPVGKGDNAAALEPCGNLGDALRAVDDAGGSEDHIVIHIVIFKRGKCSASTGNRSEGGAFVGDGDGRLLQHMDAALSAADAVPVKPVVQGFLLPSTAKRAHC